MTTKPPLPPHNPETPLPGPPPPPRSSATGVKFPPLPRSATPEEPVPPPPTFRTKVEDTAAAAVGVNVALTVAKLILAIWSGSLALILETYHSFGDIFSSAAVFIAVQREIRRRPSEPPPAGAGRRGLFDNPSRLVALGIGLYLLFISIAFIPGIFTPRVINVLHPVPVALATLLFALFSFILARFERAVGEKERCAALVADSFHARADMYGSLVVAGALFGEALGWPLDRLGAGILSAAILVQAASAIAAVVRDVEYDDPIFRERIWQWLRARLPNLGSRLINATARLLGGSPASPADRRRARAALGFAVATVILAAGLAKGFFVVQSHEAAIIERLGRPLAPEAPLGPGLHWACPWPIDRVRLVDVGRVRRLAIGSEVPPAQRVVLWTNKHQIDPFYLLSGENAFLDLYVVLHYRVANPAAWLYASRDPEAVLASTAYAILTEEFAHRPLLETITEGRGAIEKTLSVRLRERLARIRTGIDLVAAEVRDAHPPLALAVDFEEVVSASIEYERLQNEARGYANDLLPRARGDSATTVLAALGERAAAVERARGETARFTAVEKGFSLSPATERARLRLEAAEEALARRRKVLLTRGVSAQDVDLILAATYGGGYYTPSRMEAVE